MQLTNVFVSFLLAAAVSAKGDNKAAKGNSTSASTGTSVKSQCASIAKLTKMTNLAANETKLADKLHNNQTAIDAFKAKITSSQTKLTTLSSNTTLMASCAVIAAHEDAVDSCDSIAKMEKMIATAANTTKLNTEFKGNATKISSFTAKASAAATKLSALQSNSSLTDFCSTQTTLASCKTMTQLQKEIAMAGNTTALDAKFKGNSTKITKFTAQAAKAQTKLDALMSNSTLMATCASLSKASTTDSTTAGAASTTKASLAGRIESSGGMITAAVLAITAAMFML
ncbi:hypothetical protein BJ170DRAFT_143168 [Xylariales sp. AK1849]|nr:hypothetical protein BJ170DRAFT_143168 [Xylariales sp. AK1849]